MHEPSSLSLSSSCFVFACHMLALCLLIILVHHKKTFLIGFVKRYFALGLKSHHIFRFFERCGCGKKEGEGFPAHVVLFAFGEIELVTAHSVCWLIYS